MSPPASQGAVVSVAVAAPLHRLFHYRLPSGMSVRTGCRVLVPFGRSTRLGFVMQEGDASIEPERELKTVIEAVDHRPPFDDVLWRLLNWAADYYQHPVGEVLQAALPTRLRKRLKEPPPASRFVLLRNPETALGQIAANAVRQRRVIELAAAAGEAGIDRATLRQVLGEPGDVLERLRDKGLLRQVAAGSGLEPVKGPPLNALQDRSVERIDAAHEDFACFLVKGVTGSGKTEVYLECARRTIQRGRQVLVLVPEIALTPQLVARFRERLARPVAVLHSGLADGERQRAWLDASRGEADIVLGTRLAVFANLARPGLILVDEEHDPSFKQQEGFRYNARDVAIKRAALHKIPVVLGSATPSLESFRNALRSRYDLLELPERAGAATLPDIELIDTRHWPLADGLSMPLLNAVRERIERGEQSLVFINRRGYAPVVMCGDCGWQARCRRCDAFLTLHRQAGRLRCHHCGSDEPGIESCPACGGREVFFAGIGTQRIEQALARQFPDARILRIDRDTSQGRGALEQHLDKVRRREVDILVGTQLLSKGHDFPGITLVGVLNCDQGMYSVDFRAAERLFQVVTQVGGRAGRGKHPGKVLLQTRFADHPCMAAIRAHDYDAWAGAELGSRKALGMPPFGFLALLRAESVHDDAALEFLGQAARIGAALADGAVEVMDPVPAPMERRAGRFRAQLMIQSRRRSALRRLLPELIRQIESDRSARRVRWSIDVDPVDLY